MDTFSLMHDGLSQAAVDKSTNDLYSCLLAHGGDWDYLGQCQYVAGRAAQMTDDLNALAFHKTVEAVMLLVIIGLAAVVVGLVFRQWFGKNVMSRKYTRLVIPRG